MPYGQPKMYPWRDPRTMKQTNGHVINPPRVAKFGFGSSPRILSLPKDGFAISPVSARGK